jgi:hypothetical protein
MLKGSNSSGDLFTIDEIDKEIEKKDDEDVSFLVRLYMRELFVSKHCENTIPSIRDDDYNIS